MRGGGPDVTTSCPRDAETEREAGAKCVWEILSGLVFFVVFFSQRVSEE